MLVQSLKRGAQNFFVDPFAPVQSLAQHILPAATPLVVHVRGQAAALVADERGEEGSTSSWIRVAMVVAAVMVIGGIIWAALKKLAQDTAGDIGAAGNWAP